MCPVVTLRVRTRENGCTLLAARQPVLLMKRVAYLGTLGILSMIVSSCSLLSGRCLFESRAVTATGSVVTSTTDSASAILNLGEQRDYQPNRSFSWQILGPDLKNHVKSIVLIESGPISPGWYDFPVHPATISWLSTGSVSVNEGAVLPSGMFNLLSTGNAIIRITTDLADKPSVSIPLTRVQKEDWSRPYCS
jgi:hypothetical protein